MSRVPWESFRLEPERIVEGEDRAVVAVRFRAQGKDSGGIGPVLFPAFARSRSSLLNSLFSG
jgi:hypothetical protein